MMGGRRFIQFHLDVGVGDVVEEPFEEFYGNDWLEFAEIAPGRFKGISVSTVLEKLHAYTLPREQRINSEVKDLVDMVLLIEQGGLDPQRLHECISKTFKRRRTHELPETFQEPPDFWEPIYAKLANECKLNSNINEGSEVLRRLWRELI